MWWGVSDAGAVTRYGERSDVIDGGQQSIL